MIDIFFEKLKNLSENNYLLARAFNKFFQVVFTLFTPQKIKIK